MAVSPKSLTTALSRSLRRLFAPPLQAISRTGKLVQTLWDAAQLQEQNRDYKKRLGEIAMQLVEEGQLKNERMEKIIARLKRNDHLLERLELNLAQEIKRPGSTRNEDFEEDILDEADLGSEPVVDTQKAAKDDRLAEV